MPRAKYKKEKNGCYVLDRRIDGKRYHIRGKTVAEVDRKLKELLSATEEQSKAPYFKEVAEAYTIESEQRVRRSTMRGYKPRIQAAIDEFGEYRMDEIDTFDISRFYRKLANKDYSSKTISNQHIIIVGIFQTWIDGKWRGDRNPAKLASLPQAKKGEGREPPTADQIAAVKANPDGVGFIANFLMYTGMRLGEAQGIQVRDINFNDTCYGIKGSISVNKAYLWHSNQPTLEKTKTESSIRKVPIFAPLLPMLKQRVKGLKPTDFILSERSTPLTKSEYSRRWEQYCLKIGFAETEERRYTNVYGEPYTVHAVVPKMTAHQFRHEMATACYEAGVPEMVAQKILGHADIATTHKIYTHIRDRVLVESAISLNAYYATSP